MKGPSDNPKEVKQKVGFLLTETAVDALSREARKRRCWPNRVIEDLIRSELVGPPRPKKAARSA